MPNKYDTYVGYEFEVEHSIENLIKNAYSLTNYDGAVMDYHRTMDRTANGLWRVEFDGSLSNGAEFISPVQKMEQSFKTMRKFFDIVKENGSTTSHRCGCHINISLMYKGRILKIDSSALLYNLNWELLYSLWPNRLKENQSYCENLTTILNSAYIFEKFSVRKISSRNFGTHIFSAKYPFIKIKSSLINKRGRYFELRFPGGENYHLYPDKIEKTTTHFAEALKKSRVTCTHSNTYDRKIISYINRVQKCKNNFVQFPLFFGNFCSATNIRRLETLEHLDLYNKSDGYNYVYNVTKLLEILSKAYIDKPIVNTLNRRPIIYKCVKCYIMYSYNYNASLLKRLIRNMTRYEIELIIPPNESDIEKLWLIKIFPILNKKYKNTILKSVKSEKIKAVLRNSLHKSTAEISTMCSKFVKRLLKTKQKNLK